MSWVNSFKLALIKKDEKKIEELFRSMPSFETAEEMKVAANMIDEARTFFQKRKSEVAKEMEFLKKSRKFTEDGSRNFSRLNIMS